jgi:hypothetical protein
MLKRITQCSQRPMTRHEALAFWIAIAACLVATIG